MQLPSFVLDPAIKVKILNDLPNDVVSIILSETGEPTSPVATAIDVQLPSYSFGKTFASNLPAFGFAKCRGLVLVFDTSAYSGIKSTGWVPSHITPEIKSFEC